MNNKPLFQRYYSRLVKEGIIKSLICGFIVGFTVGFVLALVATLKNNFNLGSGAGLWFSLGAGIIAITVTTPTFYRVLFRPNTKQLAERIDRLGLDERLITMMELEKDESYIAMRQREDAKEKLKSVNREWLKISVFKIPVIALAVLFICSVTMVTVSAVSFEGKRDWISQGDPEGPIVVEEEFLYFAATYLADEGGHIDENAEQYILSGQNAATVTAIADVGYAFDKWSDGWKTAERSDKNITNDFTVVALFKKVEPQEEGDGDNDGKPGKYTESNKIIDGEMYYRDRYQEFYDKAMQDLIDGDPSSEWKDMMEAYFGILK